MAVIDHLPPYGDPSADVPGVDIVLSTSDNAEAQLLDGSTLRLIGALHRRFWDRRREFLLRRAQAGDIAPPERVDDPSAFIDLGGPAGETWEGRVAEHLRLADVVDDDAPLAADVQPTPQVAIRGWEETEPGVLVDGRAVPGCVFDVAVALSTAAEAFRSEASPFVITIPEPACADEAKLWTDLANVAQDRVGIERGTVEIEAITQR